MTRRRRFVVVGAGGHAKVVIATIEASGGEVLTVLDDDPAKCGGTLLGHRIEGPVADVLMRPDASVVLAIGSNRTRFAMASQFELEWGTVIHPSAIVHPSVILGPGSVVFAGAILQPDVHVGRHAIVNTGAAVDHDCWVGDFAHIAPRAALAGGVRVGEGAFMGVASSAIPGAQVGAWAQVGAGAVVIGQIEPGVTVVGVPARPLRQEAR